MNTSAESVTVCADCSQTITPNPASCGTGYAVTREGSRICYACADKRQGEELKDRSKPFCAYVSSTGQHITSWSGGNLMTVTRSIPCQLTRQSFTHDRNSYRSIRARDIHGGMWAGRGSAGICIKLRAVKG